MSETHGPFPLPNPYSILHQFEDWWGWEYNRIFRGRCYQYHFTVMTTP